ncbi:MAG: family 43 glycosylhydrolase [Bacteroidaceae bacterium]|jgi:hypothetical protein
MKRRNTLSLLLGVCFSAAAVAQVTNPFGNALVPDMIADASVQEIDGIFYCYATTDGYGQGLKTSGPPVVWKSPDFVHWSFDGTCFPSAEKQKYWAPSKVVQANGKYYIYPTINGYMYPAVSDSPEGPFRLARGEDKFVLPYSPASTLIQSDDPGGIDAEVFIDDDGQAYLFWGRRHVARLKPDMVTLDSIRTIETPQKAYSEGPIFFKRKGIYYYLYTIGGDERYQYYYIVSRVSPLGPFEFPEQDLVSTTDHARGVFGPGHGSVFHPEGSDDYYFVYLEFGRRSTNRQTYVNRMEFNADGTIRPVSLSMEGVGALKKVDYGMPIPPDSIWASSVAEPMFIKPNQDTLCRRTEYFVPAFAIDAANGSRWMAAPDDGQPTLTIDLGTVRKIGRSEIAFVRPTAGHAYVLEGSADGQTWKPCGGHPDVQCKSPHTDRIGSAFRYLRVRILEGIAGVWEWNLYE